MLEILNFKNIVLYLLIVNLVGFAAMGIDKYKAKNMKWRIPEKTLFLIALFGGSLGAIIGMYTFRHKTKKKYFTIGFPVIMVVEIVCALYLWLG